jgi:phosphatidylinositol alpha 1,6-mannosyltransferase
VNELRRVAVVTESFLPSVNGVTNSVCRVLDHLRLRGIDALVVAPGQGPGGTPHPVPTEYGGFPVVGVPVVNYRTFPVGLPTPSVMRTLERYRPDVVHVASPFVLGAAGVFAGRRLGLPVVAVYQTDVAGFARRHHAGLAVSATWRWLRRVHERADLTLAPSTSAFGDLAAHGIPRLAMWGRGVDAARFRPERRDGVRSRALRGGWARPGEVVVGYVGRLAPEKRVERLAALRGIPGIRMVVIGDGVSRESVLRATSGMPVAFTGRLDGDSLADAYAALDVFVHTGTEETFGQTLQEAMASGVSVVAPASGGPLDLVDDCVTGLLFPPEDDAALASAVNRLVIDPALRHAMGENGRDAVLPRSWTVVGDELLGHYRAAMARRSLVGLPTAA